jgi:phage terminase large subunit-like protein
MPVVGAGNAARKVTNTTRGPWTTWRKMSRHARAIKFIQTYLRSPKGERHGQLMKLAPWQKSWLEEALANGVSSAVMPCPRGQGKSTYGGAIAAWALFDEDETGAPQVPIIATTLGQAIKSVYGVSASMIRHEPELASRSIEFTGVSTPRIAVPSNEGLMFPISNEIDGLQGLDPSFAIVDELGFQSDEVWSSLVLASGKRSRSLIWGTGTPGLDRENALWSIREKVLSGIEIPGLVWREYAADPGCSVDDRAQWRKANPAIESGFLQEEALVAALALVPESHFRVFRLGQWVDGVESWLGADGRSVWNMTTDLYELELGKPTWIGVDVGIKRDSSAVVCVQYRPDGRLHAESKIWIPKKDEPVDVTDIMTHLRKLCRLYKVGAISFDPRFFDVPAKLLYDEGLPLVEIPQSVERMTPAIGSLYELIRGGQITHVKDELFAQQVLNAIPRLNERGFTLSKGKSRGRIDACIALALATDRALHKKKPRGLVVL